MSKSPEGSEGRKPLSYWLEASENSVDLKKKKNSHKVRKKSWKEETQSNSGPKPAYKIRSNL